MQREPCSGTEGNMKRFPGCSSFFPTFAVALTLMFLSLRAHGQSNLVQLVSQPGDWIGQGNTYVTTNKANFTFSGSAASIYITAFGYYIFFSAPNGSVLTVGSYTNLTTFPYTPSVNVYGNSRACNKYCGVFNVFEF